MFTLYARHEPTTDSVATAYAPRQTLGYDVVLYSDATAQHPVARWPWHYSNKPKRKHKSVMYNCNRYKLTWLD